MASTLQSRCRSAAWAAILSLGLLPGGAAAVSQQPQDPPPAPTATARGKKLVLKDGTYHIVRSYEQKGDRVRYYSLERSQWEELPVELVDWDATRKAETEKEEKRHELLEKMKAQEMADRARGLDVDASIEIAPGIFLPENEGLYVVDDRLVLPMTQMQSDVKADKGRILTRIFIPIAPSKHKVLLDGKQAILRITNPQPEFYFRTPDGREPEMQLIRATLKGNSREIQTISTDVVGQAQTSEKNVLLQKWPVARGVYRLTVGEDLVPGEYALAEWIPGQGMNAYVWDFGVDPPKEPRKKP